MRKREQKEKKRSVKIGQDRSSFSRSFGFSSCECLQSVSFTSFFAAKKKWEAGMLLTFFCLNQAAKNMLQLMLNKVAVPHSFAHFQCKGVFVFYLENYK